MVFIASQAQTALKLLSAVPDFKPAVRLATFQLIPICGPSNRALFFCRNSARAARGN